MNPQQAEPAQTASIKPTQTATGLQKYDEVIRDIVNYVHHYEVHDDAAFEKAQTLLLDALGCAIETVRKSAECRRMFGPWSPDTVVPHGCRVPGLGYELDPVKGAFDIATAIRFLDHNDAIAGADWGHPSDNLGAILAVMDWQCRIRSAKKGLADDVSQKRAPPMTVEILLVALIKAYEIQGQFLLLNAFNKHGLDHTILVKLASTAVVSWLLGLTEEQSAAAISHAFMDGHPGRVYRSGANTIPRKGWAAGEAASKAVQLCLLVRAGQAGSPTPLTMPRWGFYETIFGGKPFRFAYDDERERPQSMKRRFGTWVVKHVFIKTMPVEGHAAGAVEAALGQSSRLNYLDWIDPETSHHIKKIRIRTTAAANLIINKPGPLHNAADRDHSMQYVVGVALLKGEAPTAADYQASSPWAQSKELHDLMQRIEIVTDDQLTDDYMNLETKGLGSAVTVETADGPELEEIKVNYPLGHFANKDTNKKAEEKFARNMGLMFEEWKVKQLVDMVKSAPQTEVEKVLDLLLKGSGSVRCSL